VNLATVSRLARLPRKASPLLNPRSGEPEAYLFDHIPRTGGSYFAEILEQLVGSTSENIDCAADYPTTHAADIQRLDQFQVVVGHMRLDTVKAFRLLRPRRLISLVRDPLSQIESHYTFWRYNITEDIPHCNLAKQLSFGEFIREPSLNMVHDNPFTRHFFSLWDLERIHVNETTLAMAIKIAESYDFIGVTERLEDTTRAFVRLFPTRVQEPSTKRIDRNASKGKHEMTEADAEYLREVNQLDLAIYRHVNDQLDRILTSLPIIP